jgi:hypothetical protein
MGTQQPEHDPPRLVRTPRCCALHADVTAGILAVSDPQLAERLYFLQNAEGTALGPFDCWLLVRGLKTMALRMERQAANAGRIAAWLDAHPDVRRVNYPGLPHHPGHDVHFRQVRAAAPHRPAGCRLLGSPVPPSRLHCRLHAGGAAPACAATPAHAVSVASCHARHTRRRAARAASCHS